MIGLFVASILTLSQMNALIIKHEALEVHCANIEIIRAMHDTCTDPALDHVLSLEDEYRLCD